MMNSAIDEFCSMHPVLIQGEWTLEKEDNLFVTVSLYGQTVFCKTCQHQTFFVSKSDLSCTKTGDWVTKLNMYQVKFAKPSKSNRNLVITRVD